MTRVHITRLLFAALLVAAAAAVWNDGSGAPRIDALQATEAGIAAPAGAEEAPVAAPPPATAPSLATAVQASPPLHIVTGSGHIFVDGKLRNTSVSARRHADGRVEGEFEIHDHQSGIRVHVRVTCLTVVGKTAWLGGVVTSSSVPAWEGLEEGIRVVDGGRDGDQVSVARVPEAGVAAEVCAGEELLLHPVEAGQINVDVRPSAASDG